MKFLNSIIFNNILHLPEIFLIFVLPFLTLFLIIVLINSNKKSNLNYASFFFNLTFILYFILVLKNFNSIGLGFNSFIHINVVINSFKLVIVFIIIVLNYYSIDSLKYEKVYNFEYFFFISTCLLGSIVVISSGSLITFILGLEMQSLSLYILIALRSNSIIAVESSIKYFLVGVIASILTFIGIFFIYLHTNTIYFVELLQQNLLSPSPFWIFGLILLLAGVFFKLALFPFQFWAPDVYQSSQNGIVLFISTVSKITVIVFLIRILSINLLFENFFYWAITIIPFILITILIGAIRGLTQTNIKRIFAYSSMVNVSFILICLTAFSDNYEAILPAQYADLYLSSDDVCKLSMFTTAFFYLLIYQFLNFIFFLTLMVLKKVKYNKLYQDIKVVSDLNGLYKSNPIAATVLVSVLLSLCGLPPFLGFYNKYFVLIELLNQQQTFLATFLLFFSIVSMVYYIKLIRAILFEQNQNLSDKLNQPVIPLNINSKHFFYIKKHHLIFIFLLNVINIFGFITFYFVYKISFNLALALVLTNII